MPSFAASMQEYQRQLAKGAIQQAYKGLMEYMLHLRAHFENEYPGYSVSGLYSGYMDMSYFAVSPGSWKALKLKTAVVFVHEKCRFEAWLAGYNKQVQLRYWDMIRTSAWSRYTLVPTIEGADSIIEHVLVDHPDFARLEALTSQIETGTLRFVRDVSVFLAARAAH